MAAYEAGDQLGELGRPRARQPVALVDLDRLSRRQRASIPATARGVTQGSRLATTSWTGTDVRHATGFRRCCRMLAR